MKRQKGRYAVFEFGRVYDRRKELHAVHGGQEQGGISTPSRTPFIFVFTGQSGEKYGYRDGWDNQGVFVYTGEGQRGDMEFIRGNRAIRDPSRNGKELHLFESLDKGQGYRYAGEFVCASWEYRRGPDLDGHNRQTIVFYFIPVDELSAMPTPDASVVSKDAMRAAAYEAANQAVSSQQVDAKRLVYQRSQAVAGYVLTRADGVCESCGTLSPFKRKDGTPYLEPHHTRRVSDGGPDHPRWVAAVCPNCHREIHYGMGGDQKNQRLMDYLAGIERQEEH